MYALFRYKYDYYEFEHLVVVSASKKLLEKRYNEMPDYEKLQYPLITTVTQRGEFIGSESSHCYITQVEELK